MFSAFSQVVQNLATACQGRTSPIMAAIGIVFATGAIVPDVRRVQASNSNALQQELDALIKKRSGGYDAAASRSRSPFWRCRWSDAGVPPLAWERSAS